jgi:hypothetical protein
MRQSEFDDTEVKPKSKKKSEPAFEPERHRIKFRFGVTRFYMVTVDFMVMKESIKVYEVAVTVNGKPYGFDKVIANVGYQRTQNRIVAEVKKATKSRLPIEFALG